MTGWWVGWRGAGRARAVLVGVLLLGAPGLAATVTSGQGDRVTGEILSLARGELRIRSPFLGEVTVPLAQIVALDAEEPLELYLADGRTFRGPVSDLGASWIAVRTADGPVVVALPMLVGINARPRHWSGRIELGGSLARGNAEHLAASLAATALRVTERTRLRADARAAYAAGDGVELQDEQRLGGRLDLARGRWFVYGLVQVARDDPQRIDLRASASPGVGVILVARPSTRLSASIGPAVTHEVRRGGQRVTEGELLATLELDHGASHRLTSRVEAYASPVGDDHYRVRTETTFEVPLAARWLLSMGLDTGSRTDPPAGLERHDLSVRIGIAFRI